MSGIGTKHRAHGGEARGIVDENVVGLIDIIGLAFVVE